jgi:hypothetical protein
MDHDYYNILNIPRDADLTAIKKAFRARALECHPDRGGSHERMLLIIEAWNIFSNPDTRRRYDLSRVSQDGSGGMVTVDIERARNAAQDYPRDSSGLESWIDQITWQGSLAGGMAGLSWIAPSMIFVGFVPIVLCNPKDATWVEILWLIGSAVAAVINWRGRSQKRLVFLKKLSQKDLKRAFDSDAFFGLFLMLVGGYYSLQAWGMVNGDKVLPARAWATLVHCWLGLLARSF